MRTTRSVEQDEEVASSECSPRREIAEMTIDFPPPRSAYIHVPFCKHRCGYCDFAVLAGREDLIDEYLAALATELSWLGSPREVDTLYFGGGTPSVLSAEQLRRLCGAATAWHPLAAGYEWTVEANPEHVTAEWLLAAAEMGVTRVSLGVQSFDDTKLRALDRDHDGAAAASCVQLVRRSGMATCVDLIFAAPEEKLEGWLRDVAQAVALGPDHVSTYGLTFEKGTAFTRRRERGQLPSVEEELEREMYAAGIDALTAAGFEHYEVSNFARPGKRSRHNEAYWNGDGYFAAGVGAARRIGGVRETNLRSTFGYLRRVAAGRSPVAEREELTAEQQARERLVFGLRRLAGVERREFAATTGLAVDDLAGAAIEKFVGWGLLLDDGERVRLSREGLMVSDALWPELL